MIAGERQAGNDGLRRFLWARIEVRRHPVTNDPVVELSVEIAVVERDAGTSVSAARGCRPKPADDIGVAWPVVSCKAIRKPPDGGGELA